MKTLTHYLSLHLRNCATALADLLAQPVATGLTVAVIGVALVLPASLHLLVQNGRVVVGGWESVRDFSVYLKIGTEKSRAVASRPRLLIADEPTGNLDPELSLDIMNLFRRFNEVGVTTLIATHDLSLLEQLDCRRIELADGEVIDQGNIS